MAGAPSREAQISIAASSMFPGFRFSPTDDELISYYLKNKMDGSEKSVEVIPEIEIWKYEPWDLPAKSIIPSENEWFFFSPRGRKYPNGSQSRRATELGYWKATGKERNVKSGSTFVGTKRTLVFHIGRAPKGERTEWIMHEYCVLDKSQDFMVVCRLRKNSEFRLNDSTNRATTGQRPLSTVHNSNGAGSEVGIEQGEKAVDCSSKKCCSSYDSYSIEQMDSASESNQKLASEVTQPECSGQRKDYEDEDDFFAEILKDDIIKLDETSISPSLDIRPLAPFVPKDEKKSQQPTEAVVTQVFPFQGTANRRIRLRKESARTNREKAIEITRTESDYVVGKNTRPNSEELPKCSASISSSKTTVSRHLILVILLLLTFMALFVSMLGGFWRVRRIIYESLCRGFLRQM